MIDNPRRQILIVLIVAIAAVIGAFGNPRWGLDLAGGTVLVYEVPTELTAGPDADVDRVMDETVRVLEDRLDPSGILDVGVLRRGKTGLQIEIPDRAGQDLATVEARIQNLGRLEMRILATENDLSPDGTRFDMAEERRRLVSWLDTEANFSLVAEIPTSIDAYNIAAGSGPSFALSDQLRWYPREIRPSTRTDGAWDYASSAGHEQVQDFAVPVFTNAQWSAGPNAEGAPNSLVELLPVNMGEEFFSGEDLKSSGIEPTMDDTGLPAVGYQLQPSRQDDYADWTEEHIGDKSAIILDGVVQSAPVFESRIPGRGIIRGGFTSKDVNELVAVLRGGSLQVKPVFQARRTIGATLGNSAIQRGQISILGGGALVLAFILFYYRMAGIVAFCAIALNVLMIWGTLQFLKATLTLPGIAGMVLTMGMAVDANILIYERIREELKKGKALVQAVRAGFARAMVTILDANLTTFIAGVVLYNVGVGPIRGFAVTLMIGIMTTLFTAFLVSRLVFHFLLKFKILREFKTADLFGKLRFDFLERGKLAMATSLILILAGLVHVIGFVPRDTLLDLEFTGGANLQVVLREPMAPTAFRELLQQPQSTEAIPSPVVNPVGEPDPTNRYRQFSLKLKLTEDQREIIAQDRRAAALEGTDYTPPYIAQLERVLDGFLVEPAYGDAEVFPWSRSKAFASLNLHFTAPVDQAQILGALQDRGLTNVEVDPENGLAECRDFLVQWDVAPDTQATELFGRIQAGLQSLRDTQGNPVLLSNPFPDAEEIGGRMVKELRSAAIGAMVVALFSIVMYIRIRFREYKYGLAAVAALVHDVLISFGVLALANRMGVVSAEMNLAMIAAFLTIIGYSINDTIVIFDRIRENLSERARLGETKESFRELINRSINQTLARTILTSGTTLFVVLAQFAVNYGSGSALEGFSFALILGIITGTYSTMFIASPLILWLQEREDRQAQLHVTASRAKAVTP